MADVPEDEPDGNVRRCVMCRFIEKPGLRYCDNNSCGHLLDQDVSGFEHILQFMKNEIGAGCFPKRLRHRR